MVDVGDKPKTERIAIATGFVKMKPATLRLVKSGKAEKGDVLAAARLAGIIAAKKTPDIVPLCHPIALAGVRVDIAAARGGLSIRAEVKTVDRTGVEMEALTAVSAAALTIYDMLKSVDRGMSIAVQLARKAGGRSGEWRRGDRPSAAPGARSRPRRTARTAPLPF